MVFNVNLNLVAYLKLWVVAEFRCRNDAVALVADIDYNFFLVNRDYFAFNNLMFLNLVEGVVVSLCQLFLVATNGYTVFKVVPIEV